MSEFHCTHLLLIHLPCHWYTYPAIENWYAFLPSVHLPTIDTPAHYPLLIYPSCCRYACTLSICQYTYPAVIVVVHGAGDDVAGAANAHIPQWGEGQRESLCGDLVTQPAHVEWVGDAVAVAVEVAMVMSTCVAWPKVGIHHGLDRVVVGTWGWGWWWEWEEMMWQFSTGWSHRWWELLLVTRLELAVTLLILHQKLCFWSH